MRKIAFFFGCFLFLQTVVAQSFQDTIPFRNDLGLIIIPMTFNGVEKQFVFDTGAQKTIAYGWAKESLRPTRKTLTVTGSTGLKSKMRFYKSGKIEIGSRKVTGHRILNAAKNDIFTCHNIDGILGVDIIDQLNWTIDYKNKRLIMYPANYIPPKVKDMHKLDFDYQSARPFVFLSRKNKFRFLLDTGAGGLTNISQKNYTLTNIDEYDYVPFYSGSFDVNGILMPFKSKVFKFPEASSYEVILSPVISYDKKKSTKIGNTLWQGKRLFLSLKKEVLYVSSSTVDQAYSGYPCSVSFSNGKMRILEIEENSEPWKLGVRQGDEVRSINGQQFTDFCSLDKFRRNLNKTGKPFELELMDGKKVMVSSKTYFE
jgi:hypothetical protein